jgi:hypothetical protein
LSGYIYVADTGNPAGEVVRIPPGGGDLQPTSAGAGSALTVATSLPLFGGSGITTPSGVAVDAAGNVYVSDSTGNAVWEAPAQSTSAPFALSFSGLSAPAGLALDASGNLFVADSGNKQVLKMERSNPVVPFGTVPQNLGSASGVAGTPTGCPVLGGNSPCTGVLTVTNIGNTAVTLSAPFLGIPTNTAFTVTSTGGTACTSPMPAGTTCIISPLYTPVSSGTNTGTVTVNGTQSLSFTANGANPEAKIVLTPSATPAFTGTSPNYSIANPAGAGTETITATVKPSLTGGPTPTGTVTFSYVIDAGTANNSTANPNGCGAPGTSGPVTLVGGVATYTIPVALAQGLVYTVNATFIPNTTTDTTDSTTNATPIVLTVSGIAVQVNATSVTYTYGTAVPAITGTVTGTLPTGVTYKFTSAASQYSNIQWLNGIVGGTIVPFPIQVVFSGTGYCSLGFPPAYVSGNSGPLATVTENTAPLSVTIPAYTTVYGAATFNYASGMTITGAVGNDLKALSATFTPVDSSVLDVVPGSPYAVIPTMGGKPKGNYTIKITNGTDTVTPAPAGIAVTPLYTAVLAYGSTFTGTAASGSASVTLASTAGLVAGEQITSSILPAGTTIKTVNSSTAITLSANTTAAGAPATFTAGTAAASYAISVSSLVAAGKGVPTGTVTVYDYFVPITSTNFIVTPTAGAFPTVNGAIAWPSTVIPPCTTGVTTNCNPPVAVPLTAGLGTFVMPSTYPTYTSTGTHYFSFVYSGDAGSNGDTKADFACSVLGQTATASCPTTGTLPTTLIVDNPDFTLTSTTGPISILPGVVPSGNGLPTLPNQNSAATESAVLTINGILSFGGTINLSCATQHPTYVFCAVQQFVVVNGVVTEVQTATVSTTTTTVPFVLSVWTPTTLPLGFNTSQLRTSATRTVLAFLPFGVLAFCVRRRRRLSKALWMLIAIAAVSAGMSGCGGNQVDFYTPIPTGAQTVTVTASYTAVSSAPLQPTVSRSYVVPININ